MCCMTNNKKNSNTDKPISMVLNDLKRGLINIVNEACLPPCLIEPILKDLYEETHMLAQQQLQEDIANYSEKKNSEQK